VTVAKVDPAAEARFWSRQLLDHTLFLDTGIESPKARARAVKLRKSFQSLIIDGDRHGYAKYVAPALDLARDLRQLETDVLDALAAGRWLGWLFPSFIEHQRRAGDYFIARAKGYELEPKAELATWLRLISDDAGFAAHWIDPSEKVLVRDALAAAGEIRVIERSATASASVSVTIVEQAAGAIRSWDSYLLRAGLGTASTRSVVQAALVGHWAREAQRAAQAVNMVRARVQPPKLRSVG